MAEGFLGRWARRKLDTQEGKPVPAEPLELVRQPVPVLPAAPPSVAAAAEPLPQAAAAPEAAEPPPPTLEDAQALTPESDFKPFMGSRVPAEVKNAAMKKLFADPHYNVMDRLDTYIDDYSKPDPIPPAMLRQLASAKFLGLFREEEEAEKEAEAKAREQARQEALAAAQPRDDADRPVAPDVAQSGLCNEMPSQLYSPALPASRTEHDDPDLRLQPDHAPAGPKPGGRA